MEEGYRGGPFIKRLSSGLWELRTAHRVLGVYERKQAAKAARQRLLRRGRRCYHVPVPHTNILKGL